MLTLLTFPAGPTEPSHSPFCVKAMCLLRMSGFEWQRKDVAMPAKMPYGRLPVLQVNDRLIPDSWSIQTYLEKRGADFSPGLSATDRARGHTLMRMTEENLRLGLVHDRWLNDDNWSVIKKEFFGGMPSPVFAILPNLIRRKVRKGLTSHGLAQFTEEERMERLAMDLGALTVQLGDKHYLFGNAPTAADASVLPVLSMISDMPTATPLRDALRGNTALMRYIDRARTAIYPLPEPMSVAAAA